MSEPTRRQLTYEKADGSVMTTDVRIVDEVLRSGIETNDDGETVCPLCEKPVQKMGFGPHARAHRQAAGLVEPRKPNSRKKAAPRPKSQQKMSVEDACLGLLMGVTGRDSIPLKHLGSVSAWIRETEKLIKEIK